MTLPLDAEDDASAERIGQKLVNALRVVTDPQAIMHGIADRGDVAVRQIINTRIDAIVASINTSHEDLVRVPTNIDRAIKNLSDVVQSDLKGEIGKVTEKFHSLDAQIKKIESSLSETINRAIYNVDKFSETMDRRISGLEQYRYETGGKSAVQDPAMAKALDAMERTVQILQQSDSKGEGAKEHGRNVVTQTYGVIGAAGAIAFIISVLVPVMMYILSTHPIK